MLPIVLRFLKTETQTGAVHPPDEANVPSTTWVWLTCWACELIKRWESAARSMQTTNWSQLQKPDGNNGTLHALPYNQNKSKCEEMAVWLLHAPDALRNAHHTVYLNGSQTQPDERRLQSLFWVMDRGNRRPDGFCEWVCQLGGEPLESPLPETLCINTPGCRGGTEARHYPDWRRRVSYYRVQRQ